MDAKKFKPAVESVADIQWTIAATPDVWLNQYSLLSEEKKITSITERDGRGNESTHQKENKNGSKVCNEIDLKLREFEEKDEKGLHSAGKLSKNSAKFVHVKPLKRAGEDIEVNPLKKTVIDVKHSNKIVEAFKVIPSEAVEMMEAKSSKKTVKDLEKKSSKKAAKVIEVKLSNKNEEILETLEQKNSYTRDLNKSDIKCPISVSREGVKHCSNDKETVKDLFKKYIPNEYLDFLDGSLQTDTCSEFYNNFNDGKHVGPEERLSEAFPLNMSEKCQSELTNTEKTLKNFCNNSSPVDLNIGPKIDLVSLNTSITKKQKDNCPPKSFVQTSTETSQKAMTLSENDLNEVSDDQPKRYSFRQRKNKGLKIYDDTDEWCDEEDIIDEQNTESQRENLKGHKQTNHNLSENKNKYGRSNDHNGQNMIQQRYTPTDEAEVSMEYNYKPMKRRSAQSRYCMSCHMGFKSKGDLQIHKFLNGCDDLYRCVICFEFFSSIENLCIHGTIHNVFFCPICARCYKTKPGLDRHQLDHTEFKPSSCEKCPSTYKTRSELAIHTMSCTGDMPFHCHKCLKGFPTQGQIKRHIDSHVTYETAVDLETRLALQCHKCKKCGIILKSEELRRSHEREHDDQSEALVDLSADSFQNCINKLGLDKSDIESCDNLQPKADFVKSKHEDDSQLQIVDLTQSEEAGDDFQLKKPGVQPLEVNRDTSRSQSAVNQSTKVHGDNSQSQISDEHVENAGYDEPFYKCTQCSRIFQSHMAYLYHKLIHKRDALEKSYKCDKCPMEFHLESSLVSHQLIHRELKAAVCDACGKTFSNQLDLVYHRAVHNVEKRSLKCSKCPKVFKLVEQLSRHAETHLKDRRQFSCEICDKKFKTRSGLARHNMDHTGERRYSCLMCTKKFKTSTQLRCHVSVHTGIRPYQCKICGKSFPIKSYLTSHSMIHKIQGCL